MTKSKSTALHEETREVYDAQHKRIIYDPTTMNRFLNMIQEPYFGLGDGWFKGKVIMDAGCGNTCKFMIRFHDFGSKNIYGLELGEDFKKDASEVLVTHGIPLGDIHLVNGSITNIPLPPNQFDLVCCHGVLMHLLNKKEISKAFSELSRICKPGGYLYVVGGCYGGLMEAAMPAVRRYYRKDKEFKELIDNLKPEDFHKVIRFVEEKINDHEGEKIDLSFLDKYFDEDLCITFQNVTQAPVRHQLSEADFRHMYSSNNFTDVKRLRRYVKRSNIRRFFAPLHYYRETFISRILYGSGSLEFIGRKL